MEEWCFVLVEMLLLPVFGFVLLPVALFVSVLARVPAQNRKLLAGCRPVPAPAHKPRIPAAAAHLVARSRIAVAVAAALPEFEAGSIGLHRHFHTRSRNSTGEHSYWFRSCTHCSIVAAVRRTTVVADNRTLDRVYCVHSTSTDRTSFALDRSCIVGVNLRPSLVRARARR